jgi:predicted DNA binding CopG/RHH family protein
MKTKKSSRKTRELISDYDYVDTTDMIDVSKPLKLEDLGLKLPPEPPTQVVSIRLPTRLLNKLRAIGSAQDVPYQALIKIFLAKAIKRY